MDPLVCACISTFNRVDDLKRCIESLLMQDYPNLKIIVYNNNCPETSNYLINTFGHNDQVMYLNETTSNNNAMITLNAAFDCATVSCGAEYILVMDDDAYLKDVNVVSLLVNAIEHRSDIGIVGANVMSEDGMWQMPVRTWEGEFLSPDQILNLNDPFEYFEFHGACALFKSHVVKALKYYDESFVIYMNELDLATRVLDTGYFVKIHPLAKSYHKGVGDTNACNKRVYRFVKNYNTVLTRNFRTFIGRFKAVTLHTFMSSGYYAERILIHNTCKSKLKIFKFTYYMIVSYMYGLWKCVFPDKRNLFYLQGEFESAMYNGFKQCIMDRLLWITKRLPTDMKGIR